MRNGNSEIDFLKVIFEAVWNFFLFILLHFISFYFIFPIDNRHCELIFTKYRIMQTLKDRVIRVRAVLRFENEVPDFERSMSTRST